MNEEFEEIQEILHNEKTARITALREEEESEDEGEDWRDEQTDFISHNHNQWHWGADEGWRCFIPAGVN